MRWSTFIEATIWGGEENIPPQTKRKLNDMYRLNNVEGATSTKKKAYAMPDTSKSKKS